MLTRGHEMLGNVHREPVRYVMDFPFSYCALRGVLESSRGESRNLYRSIDAMTKNLGTSV